MLHEPGQPPRELNRLDIKNHTPPQSPWDERILQVLELMWPSLDALLVLDQVRDSDCGVVTTRIRDRLAELGDADPGKLILADSRERIGLFQSVWLKPNEAECIAAVDEKRTVRLEESIAELAQGARRPVVCTRGDRGIRLF